MKTKLWAPALVTAALVAVGLAQPASGFTPAAASPWTGTWAVSPQSSSTTFNQQTLRQIVHTSISGSVARIEVSNVFGTQPLTLRDVHLAASASGSSIVAGTDHPVTFNGASSTTIPAGASAASDPISMTISALSDVVVSAYLPQPTGAATYHQQGTQTNYIAAGDVAANTSLPGAQTTGSYYFLTGLDVQNPTATGAVVTLGASITDGVASAQNSNHRWPNDLAVRLANSGRTIGVLNEGISGNRLLADGAGPSALNRFNRDVASQPGVRWVIFSDDPINDLGASNPPTSDQLITGLKNLISLAHQHGISFLCSTLTPFQGAGYWTPQGEQGREAINAFIRGSGSGCDGIVDQDTATHDPANPTRYLPAYDNGDHLHPNEAGLQAIANAVNLTFFGAANAPKVVSFRAHANNMYVTTDNAGASPLIANKTAIGTWEQFDEIDEGNGNIALFAHANSKYVAADNAGAAPLIAKNTAVGSWETFGLIHNPDGSISLRAQVNNNYVCADNAGANPLIANRTAIGPWEEFDLITN